MSTHVRSSTGLNLIKEKLINLIEWTFKREGSPYIACNERQAWLGACKTGLSPPVFLYWPFQGGTSVVVPYCSCCLCLYFGSSIMLVTYFVKFR